jgi:hypothetical protein
VISALIARWRATTRLLLGLRRRLYATFITAKFAKMISDFLAEVAVLVFVFPGLEVIIRGETKRLYTVLPWSWTITAVCLILATIILVIGDVP